MSCREFTEVVAAWLDGELPEEESERVEEHAAHCPDCANLAEELRALDRSLAAEPTPERSEEEWSRFDRDLMIRIAMDERARAKRELMWRRLWGRALKAAAAAAVLFAAGVGGYVVRGAGTKQAERVIATVPEAARLTRDREYEAERLLAAAERILIRLSNADPTDRGELAAIRSVVIDTGLPARLAEARRGASGRRPALATALPVEMILIRVVNGAPGEASEFKEIQSAILDSALIERTRALRSSL